MQIKNCVGHRAVGARPRADRRACLWWFPEGRPSPAPLPLGRAPRRELVIDLKTARAIGVTMQPDVMLHADEVIE